MKKSFFIALFVLHFMVSPVLGSGQPIVLSLPDTVVAEVVQQCLPLQINQPAETLAGLISVEKLEYLTFKDKSLTAAVTMRGQNVQLNTAIGGHQLRLNVGNVDLQFSLQAVTRFDKASQTLFIRPTVSELNQQGSQSQEVGTLVASLFNEQEFPLPLDNLQPIIADLGQRELSIDMIVEVIRLGPQTIAILLTPKTSVKPK
ncbi:MAG: hypothetical protein P8X86_09230 [Desulfofustis sp.]